MALDELLGERVKEIQGHAFPIDPERSYRSDNDSDRAEFVKRADTLFDVEDYFQRLTKNVGDMDAIKSLTGIAKNYMVGKPEDNEVLLYENPHLALEQAEGLYDKGSFAMARFVERNRDEFLKELETLGADRLYKLFLRTPIFKRYHPSDSAQSSDADSYEIEDKEYERIRRLKEKVEQIQRASQQGEDVSSIVAKELNELIEKAPEEQRIFIMRNQHLVIPSLTKSLVRMIEQEFGSLFLNDKEELDAKKLRHCLEDSYTSVRNYIECEIPEEEGREKLQRWDDNLKMPYLEIARELLSPKKKQQKMESDDEKVVDKETRKDLARSLGMKT